MESSLNRHAAAVQQQQQQQQMYRNGGGGLTGSYQRGHHQQQSGADYMSVGSQYSRESHASSQTGVDEAYRRLGHRLSRRAHGDRPVRPQRLSRIGLTTGSVFISFDRNASPDGVSADARDESLGGSVNRTTKVAKTRYSDHGDHHKLPSRKGNVLRKMTMNAKELYRQWEAEALASRGRKKRTPTKEESKRQSDLSPQRFALSQLALGSSQQKHSDYSKNRRQQSSQIADHTPESLFSDSSNSDGKLSNAHGLLSAVIENASQASSKDTRDRDNSSLPSLNSKGSSIVTKSSYSNNFRTLPPGKCLTQPSEPAANENQDNVEGNLIAHENDSISVSRKQIHVLTRDKMRNATHADFRILGLLGQGTFAQVFQCLHLQTGNMVAVKVVKNKPAYTRQAAVEIDVFRALTKKNEKVGSSSQSTKNSDSPLDDGTNADATKWDYMVDIVCYFMHKNHLCLVFEMLGLNLYEVLKKRQFRGLPLSIVRSLVQQAVGGVRELAKKNIVHCDLKPENILLVTEGDVDSVVGAGENRRLGSSLDRSFRSQQSGSFERKTKNHASSEKGCMEPPITSAPGLTYTLTSVDALSHSPSNSIETAGTNGTAGNSLIGQNIKLIDFGSACFEGQTTHTYIQSRFYRSPEVLVGLPYDSAVDIWSLGCVAAELFLGLPILPGVHEHDQLCRIGEMISKLPDWMLEQGSKSSKYFVKFVPRSEGNPPPQSTSPGKTTSPSPRPLPQWRIRTQQEYISSLSQSEIRKKGGLAKLEKQQPTNRYFKRKKLADIMMHKGMTGTREDKELLELFIHFIHGILDPDPWKRWTAHQAASHPFVLGGPVDRRSQKGSNLGKKDENQANLLFDIYWEPPWDPGICRRKLLNVQKMREMQQTARRGYSSNRNHGHHTARPHSANSHDGSIDRDMHESPSLGPHSPRKGSPQGLSAVMATQVPPHTLMSSSLNDHGYSQAPPSRFVGDSSSVVSGPQPYISGPQSYTDMAFAGTLPGSFNEVDFAYALQRPGVVPMGESVSSASVDMRPTPNSYADQSISSYGTARAQQQLRTNRRGSTSTISRSYGDMQHEDPQRRRSNETVPASLANRAYSVGQGSYGGHADVTNGEIPRTLPQSFNENMHQTGSAPTAQDANGIQSGMQTGMQSGMQSGLQSGMQPGIHTGMQTGMQPGMQTGMQPNVQPGMQSMQSGMQPGIHPGMEPGMQPGMQPAIEPGMQNQQLAYGNAQVYLQQQHAALQQQQVLLQQQQAALALQQQQLQAYHLNPALLNSQNATAAGLGAMNQYGQTGGGYYYVSSVDGTPMMLPNQAGLAQPGMATTYGMAQQMHPGTAYPTAGENGAAQQGFRSANTNSYPGMNM